MQPWWNKSPWCNNIQLLIRDVVWQTSMSAVLRQSVYKARLMEQLSFQLSENVLWLRSDNPTNHSALYKKNMQQFTSKVVSELNVGVFAWRAAPPSETEWIAQSTFDSVQTSLTERPTSCEIFSHRSVTPPGYRATALASKVSSWSVHSLPSAACWPNTKFTMTIVQQDNPGELVVVVPELSIHHLYCQSINQSIWRIFIAPLKIKFHRGASTRRHNHTGTILNDI